MYISQRTSFLIRQQQKHVSTQKKDITKTLARSENHFEPYITLFPSPLFSSAVDDRHNPRQGYTLSINTFICNMNTHWKRGRTNGYSKGCSCYFLQQEYNHRHPPTHCCLLEITITCKGTQCPCHNIIQSTTCPIYIDRRTQREKDRKVIMRRFKWISLLKIILSITWILSLFIICPLSMMLWSRMDKHPSLWDGSNG